MKRRRVKSERAEVLSENSEGWNKSFNKKKKGLALFLRPEGKGKIALGGSSQP